MKKFINKILDVPKLILRLWIILWICLIILLVMKFCFGIWYPIVIKNQALLDFSNYVDNTWIKYLILSVFYFVSGHILYLTSVTKKKYTNIKEFILISILIIAAFAIKFYNRYLSLLFELITAVIIPIIVLIREYKGVPKYILILYPIIVQGLVFLWQLNILIVRNYDLDFDSIGTIFEIVLQVDYYIFLTLLWIEVSFMGFASFWLFCKDVTKLKAMKTKELAKSKPNYKKVEEIDKRIAELEVK